MRSARFRRRANREISGLLKDGVKVAVPDRERGGLRDERVRVVDWENPAANDFLLVSQMTVTGLLYTCRPDLIGFVNGLPWVVIELKKPGVAACQLLARLNALLVLGWRQKVQARARVRIAIEDTLDEGLPRAYTKELFESKTAVLFEHVYEAYLGEGESVYRAAF